METLSDAARDELERDSVLIHEALQSGLSHGRRTAAQTYWGIWETFCQQFELEPYMAQGPDAIYWLQIFAIRVRTGRLSASHKFVRADTVADALSHVASAHTMANHRDPRHLLGTTVLHPRLARILKGFRNVDSAPARVLPIPLQALHHACSIARAEATPTSEAAADLMWLAFFFLLRPGEFMLSGRNPHPFTLADVRLWNGTLPIDPLTASPTDLLSSTFVALIFTEQKNAVRGEIVGSGDPHACPVLATVRRVIDLRMSNAPSETPLCYYGSTRQQVKSAAVTSLLRAGAQSYSLHTNTPIAPIQLKALRATAASALLARGTDTTTIKLLGRWRSEAALRYLHLQTHSLMSPFAGVMLQASKTATFAPPAP
jgi:hypothetical protein